MRSMCKYGRTTSVSLTVVLVWFGFPAWLMAQNSPAERNSVIPINQIAGKGGQPIEATLVKAGDSSRKQRSEAIDQLPIDRLSPSGQQEVQEVLKNLSLYRRLPTLEIDVDPRAYEFFCAHPDMAVSIWRTLDISNVEMKEITLEQYQTDTSDGTVGTVNVLLRSPGSYLVLCEGKLQSPGMLRPIRAKALMHLQPRFKANGRASHHLDLFVSFPSTAVETVAKLISPLSFRIADRNFEEVTLFIALMSRAMSRQPGWVEQTARQLSGVSPSRPQELLNVTAAVYVDAERRRLTALGLPVTVESIRPPVATHTAAEEDSATRR